MLRSLAPLAAAVVLVSACNWQVTTVPPGGSPAASAAAPAASSVAPASAGPHVRGRADAPVTIEEWSDFQ